MALGQTAGCPKVNRAKKFMCSPQNTGNINYSLWSTGGLSQGCPDFQKVYVFKIDVPLSCPICPKRFWKISQGWIPKPQFWYPPLRFGPQHRIPKHLFSLAFWVCTAELRTLRPLTAFKNALNPKFAQNLSEGASQTIKNVPKICRQKKTIFRQILTIFLTNLGCRGVFKCCKGVEGGDPSPASGILPAPRCHENQGLCTSSV